PQHHDGFEPSTSLVCDRSSLGGGEKKKPFHPPSPPDNDQPSLTRISQTTFARRHLRSRFVF
ncbi:MAG: hypothetical protein WAV38_20495, partial [Xanthobacteraceae bacterium]